MKNSVILLVLFVSSLVVCAQPPDVPATPGTTYGGTISAAGAIPVADLTKVTADEQSHDIKVKAKVIDVCPKMGCWMTLEMPDKTPVFVNMKDYGFFVPTALKGKTIVLDGEAKMVKTSVEELKHYAEDAKKSPQEIAAIKEPKQEIRVTANGIVVVE